MDILVRQVSVASRRLASAKKRKTGIVEFGIHERGESNYAVGKDEAALEWLSSMLLAVAREM